MTDCVDHGRTVSLAPGGYALVGWPGKRSRCTGLHRLRYVQVRGLELTDIAGKVIRHTCDNPRCINPFHLILGSTADNNRDRAERGRSAKVVPSRQRLDRAQVEFVLANFSRGRGNPYSAIKLGKLLHVDSAVIYKIIRGEYNCRE